MVSSIEQSVNNQFIAFAKDTFKQCRDYFKRVAVAIARLVLAFLNVHQFQITNRHLGLFDRIISYFKGIGSAISRLFQVLVCREYRG